MTDHAPNAPDISPNLSRRLFLHEISVLCSIGFHGHERRNKQKVLIDLEISLGPMAEPTSDDVGQTLDYDAVRDAVVAVATAQHYDLQETLARRIFDAIRGMPHVCGLAVKTIKPDAYADCRQVAYRLSDIG